MAKSKKRAPGGGQQHGRTQMANPKKRMQSFTRLSMSKQSKGNGKNIITMEGGGPSAKHHHHQQELHQRPTIPFRRKDRILLIGEGDFSFARSLAEYHRCRNIYATCYDIRDTLFAKYPHAKGNIDTFLGVKEKKKNHPAMSENDGDAGTKDSHGENAEKETEQEQQTQAQKGKSTRKVLFSVDARKLGTPAGGGKDIRQGIPLPRRKYKAYQQRPPTLPGKFGHGQGDGPWDIISFNFPHVGGISTDVNRQVRTNQELLVAFFKACVPLLSSSISDGDDDSSDSLEVDEEGKDPDRYNTESEDDSSGSSSSSKRGMIRSVPRAQGQILVTLFEGEPYTLWNIRDLARHADLRVVTSFRFPWQSYSGYSHARTLGLVESRSGKVGGGWKGEDREARTYVFEVKSDDSKVHSGKKRAREDSSDSDG